MKKSIILIAVAMLGLATSCKKELTCSCTVTYTDVATGASNYTSTGTYSTKESIDKLSKGDARRETLCYDRKEVNTSSSGTGSFVTNYTETYDYSCKLE